MTSPAPLHHALDVASGNARNSPEALTLDTLRAARGLGLGPSDLRPLLAMETGDIDRLVGHDLMLSPASDAGARALLLVRLHRALGDVYGSLEQVGRWLDTPDPTLGARPRDVMREPGGLARVVTHMEPHCRDCLW